MCGKRYGEIRRERCALGRREGELGDRTDEEREGKGGKASKRSKARRECGTRRVQDEAIVRCEARR